MDKKTPQGERIAKVIARAGHASRREAERMIEASRVSVNGKIITSAALNVSPSDRILLDGEAINTPDHERLWLFHKPLGVVCTSKDEQGRKTIFDVLPPDLPRVMNIGRLDLNSEGLLLLTNDGEIKRKLELPSTGWLRRYRVCVKGEPSEDLIAPLKKGITLEGESRPMDMSIDRQQGANAWTVSLREGKPRNSPRDGACHLSVNRLIRSLLAFSTWQLKGASLKKSAAKFCAINWDWLPPQQSK